MADVLEVYIASCFIILGQSLILFERFFITKTQLLSNVKTEKRGEIDLKEIRYKIREGNIIINFITH